NHGPDQETFFLEALRDAGNVGPVHDAVAAVNSPLLRELQKLIRTKLQVLIDVVDLLYAYGLVEMNLPLAGFEVYAVCKVGDDVSVRAGRGRVEGPTVRNRVSVIPVRQLSHSSGFPERDFVEHR